MRRPSNSVVSVISNPFRSCPDHRRDDRVGCSPFTADQRLTELPCPASWCPAIVCRASRFAFAFVLLVCLGDMTPATVVAEPPEVLPGTAPFVGDESTLAADNVAGVHRFLQLRTGELRQRRKQFWRRDLSSPAAYAESVAGNRQSFRRSIGIPDQLPPCEAIEFISTSRFAAEVASTEHYTVSVVRWPVRNGIDAEGLLLQPHASPRAHVVALPDADQSPEMAAGLVRGWPLDDPFAHQLAVSGCQVLIPVLIDRTDEFSGNDRVGRFTNQPHREWLYRQAFQVGRHVIGFEVEKVLAAVDWFRHESESADLPIGVAGYGEGGLIALYAAAAEPTIDAVLVSGYFGPREGLADEPIYRNVWRLLEEFGDAEIASLVVPSRLIIDPSSAPDVAGPPAQSPGRSGAAPGAIPHPTTDEARAEFERAQQLVGPELADRLTFIEERTGDAVTAISLTALARLLESLDMAPAEIARLSEASPTASWPQDRPLDSRARQQRQVAQLESHVQRLMEESAFARAESFWEPAWEGAKEQAGAASAGQAKRPSPEDWAAAVMPLRQRFRDELIGRLPDPSLPPNPRTKKLLETDNWTAYLVVLDVWPEVISWGYLLLPKDLQAGERRPAVVCQHGIGGTPAATIDPANAAYRGFAAALADRGFVVYAPYNPNAAPGDTEFRQLQRRAHPLGCSIFSVITGQHQRILQWLGGLEMIDPQRIGFYGLSYGGKTAMRVPAALDGYALSICSGDYNQWVRKIITPLAVTSAAPGSQRFSSYMFTREYEIHEFDQGHTFDYAEMAAMIAPRPFMVERGHRDLVGSDEWVAFEYAPVRRLYADLGIPERTTIEFFDDGHVIHGQGSFDFLHRFLDWPAPPPR